MNQHKLDTDSRALSIGELAESEFIRFAESKGWEVVSASFKQNTQDHIDFVLSKDGKTITVDVKAQKRLTRWSNNTQTDKLWIELVNGKGEPGWVLGKADYIAFQEDDKFLIIPRPQLAERVWCIIVKELTSDVRDAYHKMYNRSGRQDVITLVGRHEIADLQHQL